MKREAVVTGVLAMGVAFLAGCCPRSETSDTVAEGTIYSVEFQREGGGTEGFSRINRPELLPPRNWGWNVDAYGRLTRDFLIITYPQEKDLGPRVIPTRRLVAIRFGDGGIKQVYETKAARPGPPG